MHLSIVTGASRGLGLALAKQLLAQGHRVLTVARSPVLLPVPGGHAGDRPGADLLCWTADLADPAPVAARLAQWLAAQGAAGLKSATLIHNAGVVSRLAPLSESGDADDLAQALRVGLEAPLRLSAAFLHATRGWAVPRKLLFISSGLGRRAMAGSASYCAAKAGLDHLARALALEEAQAPHGARVVSLAPGIIDTAMQVQLRQSDPQLFPDRGRFVAFKTNGQLDTPAAAAEKVLRHLGRDDFGHNPVADVRDV